MLSILGLVEERGDGSVFKVRKVQVTYIAGGTYEIKEDVKYLENPTAHEKLEWAAKGYSLSIAMPVQHRARWVGDVFGI